MEQNINGFQIPFGIKSPNKMYNADSYAGPYNSLEDALDTIKPAIRTVGRTVGIIQEDGKIKEYWWEDENDLSDEGLVEKNGSSTPTYMDLQAVLTLGSDANIDTSFDLTSVNFIINDFSKLRVIDENTNIIFQGGSQVDVNGGVLFIEDGELNIGTSGKISVNNSSEFDMTNGSKMLITEGGDVRIGEGIKLKLGYTDSENSTDWGFKINDILEINDSIIKIENVFSSFEITNEVKFNFINSDEDEVSHILPLIGGQNGQLLSFLDGYWTWLTPSFVNSDELGAVAFSNDYNDLDNLPDILTLGETSTTAYRGDRGKTAYDHSQETGNPHGTTKSDIGLGNVDNTSDVNKPVSTAQQTAIETAGFASRTGTEIHFDKWATYDSYSSPSDGNYSYDLTNAVIGMIQVSYHEDSVVPTFTQAGITVHIVGEYQPNIVNKIMFELIGATRVLINILPL